MKLLKITITLLLVFSNAIFASDAIKSIDTGDTITKVRYASYGNKGYIFASNYDGDVMLYDGDGKKLWKKPVDYTANSDLFIDDLNGDNVPEFLVANANGSLYCFTSKGKLVWEFSAGNEVPMYAVTTISKGKEKYIVCGGFDRNLYYLTIRGKLVKTISSNTYSKEKTWGNKDHGTAPSGQHSINFLKTVKDAKGNEVLVVNGVVHRSSGMGGFYMFKPLEEQPYQRLSPKGNPVGHIGVSKYEKGKGQSLLLGDTTMAPSVTRLDLEDGKTRDMKFFDLMSNVQFSRFGYRVTQGEFVYNLDGYDYFVLSGSQLILMPKEPTKNNIKILKSKYSYNDLAKDDKNNRMILASAQSGGSCIHIIDLNNSDWQNAYENLEPKGKIAKILENSDDVRKLNKNFKKPSWEREQLPVYFLSESHTGAGGNHIAEISANYKTPVFLNNPKYNGRAEDWDRSSFGNPAYEKRRDGRRKYNMSQNEFLDYILPCFKDMPGICYWGGHGNDPMMFSLDSQKKVLDAAEGKKTVFLYPELESRTDDFLYVLNNYHYPLAEYMRGKNGQMVIRTKYTFWLSSVYTHHWDRLLSGEFADIMIPSMEETSCKSMELSLAGRLGVWSSGSVDAWGDRCARDNPSFDRMRQFSHQMLPNHFLRSMIYRISYGATYLDNFPVDQEYMSLLWELIASGVLYVPKRDEIVSISPVHLSMLTPDEDYLYEGNECKWTSLYDELKEKEKPLVFSRLTAVWIGAKNTDWDFSRYAAGVKDRRLNFLPPYENGMVMITPVDKPTKYRKNLSSYMNPIYKDIMKEYFTDGRYYYKSAEKKDPIEPTKYYKEIQKDIKANAKKLPVTVTGENVAWVAAQSAKNHLRVTILDGGYINPNDREATLTFNTITPKKVVDLLTGKSFEIKDGKCVVDIPCGLFRFLDVEF